MEPSPTSKVTVTYWDPAALYPIIAPDLLARLPLRNLHWKSPTRPLRSISSLHVELQPYSPPTSLAPSSGSSELQVTSARSFESMRSSEFSIRRSSSRSKQGPRKERRHQIPGLRNTPYLKVYILRCDDNDSYKNTQRKLLREWVSAHAASAGGDNHDAFEWLILHVVLPGTPAAQQPRSASSASNHGSGSRWIKGTPTTLLDKIRSDFNGSSLKVDRIAQIRVPPTHPSLHTLSPPVAATNATVAAESTAETDMAWLDLVAKLKTQILNSFDARVGQYEEDVREKDSQRRLPGWNFCTFFVLKEGLARAFESVGLVEDALVLYDELGFGLEAIVKAQEKGEVIGDSFIRWTKEGLYWLEEAQRCLKARKYKVGESLDETELGMPVASEKKAYRELILSNEISIFDFRCYLFARQAALLLRLGRRNGLQQSPPSGNGELEGDDLLRLSEVCRRGTEFVTTVSRVLRADLSVHRQGSTESSKENENEPTVSKEELDVIIDNLVASWGVAVCSQLLDQTVSAALPAGLEEDTDQGFLPRRKSSLAYDTVGFSHAIKGNITGLEELAAARADMIVLERAILESVGIRRGWISKGGWFAIGNIMEVVDLDAETTPLKRGEYVWLPEGIISKSLKLAVEIEDGNSFYDQFAQLSQKAMRHYGLAKRFKSAERMESDLAALKFHLKDFEAAAVHLQQMTDFYAEQGWGLIETTLLSMFARCLKEMQRPRDYVGVLLKLLAKSAAAEDTWIKARAGKDENSLVISSINGDDTISTVDVQGYVFEAVELSTKISEEIKISCLSLWSDVVVDPFPRHFTDKDGFEVAIKMRYLLSDPLQVDQITIKIASTSKSRELFLTSDSPVEMRKGIFNATVTTNQTVPGNYTIEEIIMRIGNIVFTHDPKAKTTSSAVNGLVSSQAAAFAGLKWPRLCFYPALRALNGRLETPKNIHIHSDKMRTVEVVLMAGENNISSGELRLRSGTAGLRLITSELEILTCADSIKVNKSTPGTLALKSLLPGTVIRLSLPYSSENDLTEIMIRLEVDYTTGHGDFVFIETISIPVALPLAVNVQDIFKDTVLYSKFQVSTAAAEVPLRVFNAKLHDSKSFHAEAGVVSPESMTVFSKQPANFIFKIKRKNYKGPQESLSLVVEYTNLDEELRHTVSSIFELELKKEGLQEYVHWLLPGLLSKFRNRSPNELEIAALLEEVPIGTYDEYGWEDVLEAIDPRKNERKRVETWLRSFFMQYSIIPLNQPQILQDIARSIIIPVEVPALQVVHTVELNLICDKNSRLLSAPYAPPMVTVGVPLAAELVIRHSRGWDTSDSVSSEPMEFLYEVQNNPDIWLVNGRKRAHFTATQGDIARFSLLLVPAKPGYLVLPNVEINHVPPHGGDAPAELLSLETDYKANAVSILVLPDVRSTTVRIDSAFGVEQVVSK